MHVHTSFSFCSFGFVTKDFSVRNFDSLGMFVKKLFLKFSILLLSENI